MKAGNITDLQDTFSYKTKEWLSDQKYILSVRDTKKDRQIIPIILIDNGKLVDLDEDEFNNKIWTTTNYNKDDKPLTRFFENQLIAINYGNLTDNNNEKDWVAKIKTYNENVNPLQTSAIIEIIEGELVEESSLFKPKLEEMYKLIKEYYIEAEQFFFILHNGKLIGPFKPVKLIDDTHFRIIKSNADINFGEYIFDEESFLEFESNEIIRRIYITNCSNLNLVFKKDYDFISDEDLLKDFEKELGNHPDYFNEKNLVNVLSVLKKATEIDKIETKIKQNYRLQNILIKGEKILNRDIDLLNNIPEIKELKENKQRVEDEIFNSNKDLQELISKKTDLEFEIKSLEENKSAELENRKNSLDKEIEDLELRKSNLKIEVDLKKSDLESNLEQIKTEIDRQKIIEDYLKAGVKKLQDEFTSEQKDAQYKLAELVKGKTHFDFISGRDLSEQDDKIFIAEDFTIEDHFKQNQYREFRNELVAILKQNNRNFEAHFVDNLLISIYQNTLTIFAGVPGTGKTTLARILTNILSPRKKIREVSVSRGWTSQKDFIGFVNPLTKKFHSSSTDIFSLAKQLNEESKNEDIYMATPVSFIILDEANLSPLEHYWSSFYNLTDSTGMLEVKLGHNETIKFPNNLRFIGTINYDHTTEELSPRVLDRINIIQLNKSEDILFSTITNSKIKNIQISFKRCIEFFELMHKDSIELKIDEKIEKSYREIKSEFKNLKIFISPRVEIAIKRYIIVASKYMSDVNKPLDYCIAQRLLPLINLQGSEIKFKLEILKDHLKLNKCEISTRILEDIIMIGSEDGIYKDNFNYFLTLSNV